MTEAARTSSPGRVASLHLHPADPNDGLKAATSLELVADKGIRDDRRFFGRVSRSTGKPSRRQVSLTEREQIAAHATALGLGNIPPGAIRSNIETTGVDLISLIGCHVVIGETILHFYEPRTPCAKMDALCVGLRALMENNRQGVMAEIVQSGSIRVGDAITPLPSRR